MMDSSFLKTQHPVVEELLTNKYFGDTLLVCANGHLTDNKLAVGLLFPSLLTSDIFGLPIENVLLVPDYTMEEIGREFEKLLLQTFPQGPPAAAPAVQQHTSIDLEEEDGEEVQELVIDESAEEGCQPSTSYSVGPPQEKETPTIDLDQETLDHTNHFKANASNNFETTLEPLNVSMDPVEAVDVQNGFELNCHHIEIGQVHKLFPHFKPAVLKQMFQVADTDGSSIQIYVQQVKYQKKNRKKLQADRIRDLVPNRTNVHKTQCKNEAKIWSGKQHISFIPWSVKFLVTTPDRILTSFLHCVIMQHFHENNDQKVPEKSKNGPILPQTGWGGMS